MAESSPNRVAFERAIKRENARQKRHRKGCQHRELNQHLEQHQEHPLIDSLPTLKKKARKKSQVKHAEGWQVLHTFVSARSAPPPPPPTNVPPAFSPLRPPLPYDTPTDLPTTIEELLDQVPDYQEVPPPPQEEIVVVEEKEEKKGFGWNLPPKKGVPYTTLFWNPPISVNYEEKEG